MKAQASSSRRTLYPNLEVPQLPLLPRSTFQENLSLPIASQVPVPIFARGKGQEVLAG